MTEESAKRGPHLLPDGIRARLIFLIALVLLPMISLLGWVYLGRYETRREQAIQTELEVARGVATTFSAYLADIRRSALAAGEAILTFSPYSRQKATRVLRAIAAQYPTMRGLNWVSSGGEVLASSQPELLGISLADRSYFQQILSGKDWALGELTPVGRDNDTPVFGVAVALRSPGGTLQGIVVAGIDPDRQGELVLTQNRPAEGAYAIFDATGTLVYRSLGPVPTWEDRISWKEFDPLLQHVLKTGRASTGEIRPEIPGGDWISARVPVPEFGWVAGAGRPKKAALAPVRQRLIYDAALAALIASTGFLLAWVLARTIALPLQKLERDTELMGTGQIEPSEDSRAPKEIRRLRASVTEMAIGLLRRTDALRQSEARYRSLFTTMSEGFALGEPILDDRGVPRDFRFLEINRAFEEQTGLPPGIVGQPASEALPQLEAVWTETYGAVALSGVPVRFEQFNRDTGRTYDVYCYRPAEERFAILFRDVTEHHRMQEALRESEERFRTLADNMSQLAWMADEKGWIFWYNRRWYEYTGTTLEEMQGWGWQTVHHPLHLDRVVEKISRCFRTGEFWEDTFPLRGRHGEYRWFLSRALPIRDEEDHVLRWFGTNTDITEQRRAEEALRRQAETMSALAREKERTAAMLDSMLTHAPAGFAFFDREHRYVRINEFLSRINGLPVEAHLGKPIREVLPENAKTVDPLLDRIFAEGQSIEQVEVEGQTPLYPGETRHWLTGWYPVPLPEGQEPLVGGVVLEITEQKRLEQHLREAQAALMRVNESLERRVQERTAELTSANQELEAFTYSVSHDLRAPLRHITSFVQLLGAKHADQLDTQGKRYIQIIADAGQRMGALIDDLLTFSRIGRTRLTRTSVDLQDLTEEVRRELAPEAQGRHIEWMIGNLPRVQADPLLLRTAVTNLLSNALKYTRHRDPAIIEVGSRAQGEEMVYYVRDNGAGFDMRYADKLFGVFQRLHRPEEFEGTGIGLASVRRIIQRHGGETWAEGEIDRGATFSFSLPVR